MDIINHIFLNPKNSTFEDVLLTFSVYIIFFICVSLSIVIMEKIFTRHTSGGIKLSFYKRVKFGLISLLWIYFIKIIIDVFAFVYLKQYSEQIMQNTGIVFKFLIYIVIIINLFKFISEAKRYIIQKNKRNDGGYDDFRDINAIFKAIELGAVVLSFILILMAFNIPLTALGAFSGVAVAGLTLSQSTLLTNLTGGLIVIFNRKYSEGDIIYSDINSSVKFAGTINKIGILTTQVDSYDTMPMHIPNSVFLSNGITNASRRPHRRMVQYFTIPHKDLGKFPEIREQILKMLHSHEDIDQNKTVAVSLASGNTNMGSKIEGAFGISGVNFQIYILINKVGYSNFLKAQDDILIKTVDILHNNNIKFAINPISVNIENKADSKV